MAQCASLIAPYGLIASPAGLTTQVGFIRLAHLKCPKSGKPDFGWSILFLRSFCEDDGLHRNSGLPELRTLMRRKSGIPDLRVKPGNDTVEHAWRNALR